MIYIKAIIKLQKYWKGEGLFCRTFRWVAVLLAFYSYNGNESRYQRNADKIKTLLNSRQNAIFFKETFRSGKKLFNFLA